MKVGWNGLPWEAILMVCRRATVGEVRTSKPRTGKLV
jgi:hypothetical protein